MPALLSEALSDPFSRTVPPPFARFFGDGCGSGFFPERYSLWRIVGVCRRWRRARMGVRPWRRRSLRAGGTVGNRRGHGGGRATAVIVEAGVAAMVRAIEDTSLVHVGPSSWRPPPEGPLGPAAEPGRGIHVISAHEAKRLACTLGTRRCSISQTGVVGLVDRLLHSRLGQRRRWL